MWKDNLAIVENKMHPRVRLNAICPYFTMFPLTFPFKVLHYAKKTDLVFDPFCGRGTTNFAARLLGLESYGMDSNPIAYAVAKAKLIFVNANEIYFRCIEILNNHEEAELPHGEFWEWSYHYNTLIDICKLRNYFLSKRQLDETDIALRAILLGILHGPKMQTRPSYLSNQMPRTFATKPNYSLEYWKRNSLIPLEVSVSELIKRKAEYIFNEYLPRKTKGNILLADSRNAGCFTDKKFDWVITSPPYWGMSTYEQDQWLRNWFLGGPSIVNYSQTSQLKHHSEMSFINDLSKVWVNTADKCKPHASLVVRFGALPSKSAKTPAELIRSSFQKSNCGWKITTIRSAGRPIESSRQANQFKSSKKNYIEEIDVFASLKK